MKRVSSILQSSMVLRLFSISNSLFLLFNLWVDHKNNYLSEPGAKTLQEIMDSKE